MSTTVTQPPVPPVTKPKNRSEKPTLQLNLMLPQHISMGVTKLIWLSYPLSGEQEKKFTAAMAGKCERFIFGGIHLVRAQYCIDIDHGDNSIYVQLSSNDENQVGMLDKLVAAGWDITGDDMLGDVFNKSITWKYIWHYLIDMLDHDTLRRLMRRSFDLPLTEAVNRGHYMPKEKLEKLNTMIMERRALDRTARRTAAAKLSETKG